MRNTNDNEAAWQKYFKEDIYKENKEYNQFSKQEKEFLKEHTIRLQMIIANYEKKIRELESALAEANKELKLLRPFGIIWRPSKTKDVKITE